MKHTHAGSSHSSARAETGTVTFNVGGKHFEVLDHTIEAKPTTLLATLLDDIGTDSARPIFVDANPERFAYILDWYRYGEIHLPAGYPVQSILNDARFFLLPDSVNINGCPHVLRAVSCEEDFRGAATSAVLDHWPTFQQYVEGIVAELRENTQEQLTALSERAASEQDAPHGIPRPCKLKTGTVFPVTERSEPPPFGLVGKLLWCDARNVCNRERLQVLVAELKERGLKCEVAHDGSGTLSLNVDLQEGKLWEHSGVQVKRPAVEAKGT